MSGALPNACLTGPAADNVRFTVTGPGATIGVGNGDPSCHEPDKADQRSAFNGLCQVLVRMSNTPGRIVLQAEADGLKTATLKFNSVSAR